MADRKPPHLDSMLELGVAFGHAIKSDSPNLQRVEDAIARVLKEVPLGRRAHVAFYLIRASLRQVARDVLVDLLKDELR